MWTFWSVNREQIEVNDPSGVTAVECQDEATEICFEDAIKLFFIKENIIVLLLKLC